GSSYYSGSAGVFPTNNDPDNISHVRYGSANMLYQDPASPGVFGFGGAATASYQTFFSSAPTGGVVVSGLSTQNVSGIFYGSGTSGVNTGSNATT
ncbi:hypothetical protein AB0177_27410, partial [Klebsiella pneumoniae]